LVHGRGAGYSIASGASVALGTDCWRRDTSSRFPRLRRLRRLWNTRPLDHAPNDGPSRCEPSRQHRRLRKHPRTRNPTSLRKLLHPRQREPSDRWDVHLPDRCPRERRAHLLHLPAVLPSPIPLPTPRPLPLVLRRWSRFEPNACELHRPTGTQRSALVPQIDSVATPLSNASIHGSHQGRIPGLEKSLFG